MARQFLVRCIHQWSNTQQGIRQSNTLKDRRNFSMGTNKHSQMHCSSPKNVTNLPRPNLTSPYNPNGTPAVAGSEEEEEYRQRVQVGFKACSKVISTNRKFQRSHIVIRKAAIVPNRSQRQLREPPQNKQVTSVPLAHTRWLVSAGSRNGVKM